MAVPDLNEVRSVAGALLSERGLELVDVELEGAGRARTLRVLVERAQPLEGAPFSEGGLDLEVLAQVSGPLSAALDAVDVVSGPYTLEVSSPGLERPLRRPADFHRFVGTTITLKSDEVVDGARRHRGVLVAADDDGVTVEVDGASRRFAYDGIGSARTVFEWAPAPKPGKRPAKQAAAAPPERG